MNNSRTHGIFVLIIALVVAWASSVRAQDWTQPVEVTYDQKRCISYRAQLSGSFVLVEAMIEPGWHTFAMDNKQRAEEKLQGKKSLSQDQPTAITLAQGLEVDGPWFQSQPKDFSKPALRWYSWGFEGRALFAAKVRRSSAEPARIGVSGQVCTESVCRRIDVVIPLPIVRSFTGSADPKPMLKDLIQVR